MAVITLGSSTGPTILGGEATVTTGTEITTLPISSPVSIVGSGNNADSYWNLITAKLLPENLTYKTGLGVVDDGDLTNHVLLYDANNREIKKIDGSELSLHDHVHTWSDITSGTPTTLAGYGIGDQLQPLDSGLTSLAGLTYSSSSFVKMTAANTFSLDTNSYSTTSHVHTGVYEAALGNPSDDGYILSSLADGTRSWIAAPTGGGSGVTAHSALTGLTTGNDHTQYALLASPSFTTSFGFSTWRFVLNGTTLDIKYNNVLKGSLASDGTFTTIGDVVAYG